MVNMCPYSGIASQCFKKPRAVTAGKKYSRVARVPEASVPEVTCSRSKCSRGSMFQKCELSIGCMFQKCERSRGCVFKM